MLESIFTINAFKNFKALCVLVIGLGPEGITQMNKTKFSVKRFGVSYICALICLFKNLLAILFQPTEISSMLEIILSGFLVPIKIPILSSLEL